jgi:hypothetical protein
LSAVDPEVAQKIFDQCLQKVLHGKTVVLATHSIHLLEKTDHIYFLEEGRVVDDGKYYDLVSKSSGAFSNLVKYDKTRSKKEAGAEGDQEVVDTVVETTRKRSKSSSSSSGKGSREKKSSKKEEEEDGKLIVEEDKGVGGVNMSIYWAYFRRWGNLCTAFFTVSLVFLYCISRLCIPIWLQWWIDHEDSARGVASNSSSSSERVARQVSNDTLRLDGDEDDDDVETTTVVVETAFGTSPFSEAHYQLITAGLTVLFLSFGEFSHSVIFFSWLIFVIRLAFSGLGYLFHF